MRDGQRIDSFRERVGFTLLANLLTAGGETGRGPEAAGREGPLWGSQRSAPRGCSVLQLAGSQPLHLFGIAVVEKAADFLIQGGDCFVVRGI